MNMKIKEVFVVIKNYVLSFVESIEKLISFSFDRKCVFIVLGMIIFGGLVLLISNSFAVEVPVETISFTSADLNFEDGEEGAWKVTKSAEWLSKNKARVTYNLTANPSPSDVYTDYILVVDGSLNEHDSNFSSALKTMLTNMFANGKNRVALIGFNDTASLITDFSYDDTRLNVAFDSFLTESRTAKKEISYYSAFSKIEEVMSNYEMGNASYVKVVFVTDGKPVVDSLKEISIYQSLKENYQELSFLAIQYEMGDEVVDFVKNISDEQIVTNKDNVWKILPNIYFGYDYYETFLLSDYFKEPFTVSKVAATNGSASILDDYSIEWNLLDNSSFGAGGTASLTVDLNVSDNYVKGDVIAVTDSTIVDYNYNGTAEIFTTNDTPTLATAFNVTYDANAPDSCTVTNMPSSNLVGVYDIVKPSSVVPKCLGYMFKGWKMTTTNVTMNSDGTFTMPYKAVTLKATWAKASLSKSADGEIYTKATLYSIIKDETTSSGLVKTYTGSSQDKVDGTGKSKIYYYSAANNADSTKILNKNNVVFAGMCWQMIRTTDTGGVKLLYNGEVDSDGSCGTSRSTHPGYSKVEIITLNSNHYYGTDYTYDKTLKSFKAAGDKVTVNTSNPSTLVGTYTCLNNLETVSCNTLYQVLYVDGTNVYAAALNSSATYNTIGTSTFNNRSDENKLGTGYMYNDTYSANTFKISNKEIKSETIDFSVDKYSNDVRYDSSSGLYSFVSSAEFWEIGGASLDELTKGLIGKYVLPDNTSSSVIRYILSLNFATENVTYYYIELTDGELLDEDYVVYGDSYKVNNDGTYRITNPTLITKGEFYYNYNNYKGKYFGEDLQMKDYVSDQAKQQYINSSLVNTNRISKLLYNNSSASELTTTNYKEFLAFIPAYKIYNFYKSVTYSNGMYSFNGDITSVELYDTSDISRISDNHYTCFNNYNECSTIYYVYYLSNDLIYYIELSNGDTISSVMDKLVANEKNSVIKSIIEGWYNHTLSSYTSYLEDVIYCSDRSISSYGGFNSNGGSITSPLTFKGISNTSLICDTKDRLSVSNSLLKYPVGLLTGAEANLMGNNTLRKSQSEYWLMSSGRISGNLLTGSSVSTDGSLKNSTTINSSSGIRPVITIKGDLDLASGDGSVTSPYVIGVN